MVPDTCPWYPPAGGLPDASAPPHPPCPPVAVMVSEVTSAGTVKFCNASLSKPNVCVTVVAVAALAGVAKNAGVTRLPAPTIETTEKSLKIRLTPICTSSSV